MIEPIEGMPERVLGFKASGKVTGEDYRTVLEPALRAAAETGEIRLLYVLEPDAELAAGAMVEDARTGLELGVGHHAAWKRTAIATDTDWIAKSIRMFAWMTPGDVRVFPTGELASARDWVAGG